MWPGSVSQRGPLARADGELETRSSEARENVEASEKALLETTQELEMANKEYAAMLDKTPMAKVVYDPYQEKVSGEIHELPLIKAETHRATAAAARARHLEQG